MTVPHNPGQAEDGDLTYLQRGLLRASHRAISAERSRYVSAIDPNPGAPRLWRPWRPHTERELLIPGEIYEYLVDVFPVSHVFHPGHELVVKIHAPGLDDNDYVYVPKTGPSVNTLYHDPEHPSRITLPVISDATVGPPTAPCADDSMRCVYPTLENESRVALISVGGSAGRRLDSTARPCLPFT